MWGLPSLVCGPQPTEATPTSHRNAAWWESQVACAVLEDVQAEDVPQKGEELESERFYKFIDEWDKERWIKSKRLTLSGPPDLGGHLGKTITAFTEVRQPYWHMQPHNWITYHAFNILEVDNGALFLLVERKSDLMELVVGEVNIPIHYIKAFRATGPGRNPSRCYAEPRQPVHSRVTVRHLLAWLDGPVEEQWKPYNLLSANCQHFSNDLQAFLLNPATGSPLWSQPLLPPDAIKDRMRAMQEVRRSPQSLKYMPDWLRGDRDVVLAAVCIDGNAIRYATDEMRADRQVAIAALRQNGYCLPYLHKHIRKDRAVVLEAVQQNGAALCHCGEENRSDKEVVLAAVTNDTYAWRAALGTVRWDPEVMAAAAARNPFAFARITLFC